MKKSVSKTQNPTLNMFMAQVKKYSLLSREQENELTKKYFETKDKKIETTLVNSNIRYVLKVAYQYSGYEYPILDLVQEGSIGLLVAVRKFKPTVGVRLITYATWWIKAYIRNYIMANYSLVKMGTTGASRVLFFSYRKTKSNMEALTEGEVSDEQISEELGFSLGAVESINTRLTFKDVSLNSVVNGGHDGDHQDTYMDYVKSNDHLQDEVYERKEIGESVSEILSEIMDDLNPKQQMILLARVMSDEPKTLAQIAIETGVSRERIRQIELQILKKFKVKFETEGFVAA